MENMIKLMNIQWAGKKVFVNKDDIDFVAGTIVKLEWVLDKDTYKTGPKVGIYFTEDSDTQYRVFKTDTLKIELDTRE